MRLSKLQRRILIELFPIEPEIINDSKYYVFDLPLEKLTSIYTLTELARRVKYKLPSVSRSFKTLTAFGLVTRRKSGRRNNMTSVCLTDKGIKEAEILIQAIFDKIPSQEHYDYCLKLIYERAKK